jgi:predicted O-methyltransferase YrrM
MLDIFLAISLSLFQCADEPATEISTQLLDDSTIEFQAMTSTMNSKMEFEVLQNQFSNSKNWEYFKQETALEASRTSGWCPQEKACLIMDCIKNNQCQQCIEIGVFSGASLLPIAKTLQHNGTGIVYAIDPWDALESTKGFKKTSHPSYVWWNELDYNNLYNQTLHLIRQHQLQNYCKIIRKPSQEVADLFGDATIDFIHIDGNHNEEFVSRDVMDYFSKVKDGGYILLNDANWYSMRQALIFLLERCDAITPFEASASYLLFRKSAKRIKQANRLLENNGSLN